MKFHFEERLIIMNKTCKNCKHYDQSYTDDGYVPWGNCRFSFPKFIEVGDKEVNETDFCDLFTSDDES